MPPPGKETPFSAPLDIRFVGILNGRYSLSRLPGEEGPAIVYACRTQSLSPSSAAIVGPVAEVGQGIGLVLEHVGLIQGQVARRFVGGFHVDLTGGDHDRKKLAAKINWLKKRNVRLAADKRDNPRQRPRNPTAHFYLGEDEHECFVIDVSLSGAGISSTIRPPVATSLQIGNISGRVVRHMDVGFALQFEDALTAGAIEQGLGFRRESAT